MWVSFNEPPLVLGPPLATLASLDLWSVWASGIL